MRKEDTPTYIEDVIVGVHDEDHTILLMKDKKKLFYILDFTIAKSIK